MKKYLLLIGLVAILITGCGNTNTTKKQITVDDEVKAIAKELAIASSNNDNDKMIKLGNDLLEKNAILKEILIKRNCHEVVYSYMGKPDSVKYCK